LFLYVLVELQESSSPSQTVAISRQNDRFRDKLFF